jgi:isoleucyl-tRNA synthetase
LDAYDVASVCRRIDEFIDDLSTWYVRRSRRRFWKAESGADKEAAYLTLFTCLRTLVGVMAPIVPFWTEEMYQNLVRSVDPAAPESIHLTAYPEADGAAIDDRLSEEMAAVRRIVSMGHGARRDAKLKVRQPLASLQLRGDDSLWEIVTRYADLIQDEVNVKAVQRIPSGTAVMERKARGEISRLGPRLGGKVRAVQEAISKLSNEQLTSFVAAGKFTLELPFGAVELTSEDVTLSSTAPAGLAVKEDGSELVALDTRVTADLVVEGHVRELVHALQGLRKDMGLEVSDRIVLQLAASGALAEAIEAHSAYIKNETLAESLTMGVGGEAPVKSIEVNGIPVQVGLQRA